MAALPSSTDVLVVGAGLAGACVAAALRGRADVLVLDTAMAPASGASGAAAGLVNPFMGRKATPSWRHDEALAALDALLAAADAGPLLRRTGIVRPAASGAQAAVFRDRAALHADLDWFGPEASRERWPAVAAPEGALFVRRGGHVRIPALVGALLSASGAAVRLGARLEGWSGPDALVAITDQGSIRCRRLVLAPGDGAARLGALAALPLHRVKGQTARLARPEAVPPDHPAVAGRGYAVPEADGVVVGSTFEHDFAHTEADPALDAGLRAQAARLLPALAGAPVLGRSAGVRVTVPASVSPQRLPLAGALPGVPGVWVVAGLGAKGLLTAPLLARHLAAALLDGAPLPPEVAPASVLG